MAGRQEEGSKRRCLSGAGEEGEGRPHRAAEQALLDRRPDSAAAARRLSREYASLAERDAIVAASHSFSEGASRRAHGRNRYRDVLPYDATRVRLPRPHDGGGGGAAAAAAAAAATAPAAAIRYSSDYINASHVAIRLVPILEPATTTAGEEEQPDSDALVAAALAAVVAPTSTDEGATARYVATQGPLPSTSADFWAMVAALGSPAVVMLTNMVERGVVKCHPYFPAGVEEGGEEEGGAADTDMATAAATTTANNKRELLLPSRNLSVRCVRVSHGVPPEAAPPVVAGAQAKNKGALSSPSAAASSRDAVTVRRLQLRCTSSGRVLHELDHYHLHAWPDHGVPAGAEGGAPVRALCRALELSRQQRRQAAAAAPNNDPDPPVVVHCSAGIGRTGTFCAVDVLLRRMWALGGDKSGEQGEGGGDNQATPPTPPLPLSPLLLDVPSLVLALRAQRAGMVQTLEQYAYVGAAALEEAAALAAGVGAPPRVVAREAGGGGEGDGGGK
jgi:protein tyrosine phosphatase